MDAVPCSHRWRVGTNISWLGGRILIVRQVVVVVGKHLGRLVLHRVASSQCLGIQHHNQDPADVQDEPSSWSQDIEHTDKQPLVMSASDGLGVAGHNHFAVFGSANRHTTRANGRAVVTVADELGLELCEHDAKVDALNDRASDEDPVQDDQGFEPAELGHTSQVGRNKETEACVEGVDDGVDNLDRGGGVDADGGLQVCNIEAQHQGEGWDLRWRSRERESESEIEDRVWRILGVDEYKCTFLHCGIRVVEGDERDEYNLAANIYLYAARTCARSRAYVWVERRKTAEWRTVEGEARWGGVERQVR